MGGAVSAREREDDEGSVLLLTLGYAVLALVLILVCASATSLYLTHKRAAAAADAAALAGADGFVLSIDDGVPSALLVDADVQLQAASVIAAYPTMTLVEAETPDGRSARVTVETAWHPPFVTLFVPEGVAVRATATSRTALR